MTVSPSMQRHYDVQLQIDKLNSEVKLLTEHVDYLLQHNIEQNKIIVDLLAALTLNPPDTFDQFDSMYRETHDYN